MKKFLFFAVLLVMGSLSAFAGGKRESAAAGKVVIWTYDSFTSEWGPGAEIAKRFAGLTGLEIQWVSHGEAGELLAKLLLEGDAAGADVILGLDQNLAERALSSGLLAAYQSANYAQVFPFLGRLNPSHG